MMQNAVNVPPIVGHEHEIYNLFQEFTSKFEDLFSATGAHKFGDVVEQGQALAQEYRGKLDELYPDSQETRDISDGQYNAPWLKCITDKYLEGFMAVEGEYLKQNPAEKDVEIQFQPAASMMSAQATYMIAQAYNVSNESAKASYEENCNTALAVQPSALISNDATDRIQAAMGQDNDTSSLESAISTGAAPVTIKF